MRLVEDYALTCLASFNSRTPGGVRLNLRISSSSLWRFQFTHPGRGATSDKSLLVHESNSFNSRTPGGVRPNVMATKSLSPRVSIHAPREGCDRRRDTPDSPPCVSIHAPREGCDRIGVDLIEYIWMFQFTHPGRGATQLGDISGGASEFQFTHPGRGATWNCSMHALGHVVSIHAPREGCDCAAPPLRITPSWFQFTHPGRGATIHVCV